MLVVAAGKGSRDRTDLVAKTKKPLGEQEVLRQAMKTIQGKGRPVVLWFQKRRVSGKKKKGAAVIEVTLHEQGIGLLVRKRPDVDKGAVVSGFKKYADGSKGPAEACGEIQEGQVLAAINGESCLDRNFKKTIKLFKAASRPMTLRLTWNPDFSVTLPKVGPVAARTVQRGGRPAPAPFRVVACGVKALTARSRVPERLCVVASLHECVGASRLPRCASDTARAQSPPIPLGLLRR